MFKGRLKLNWLWGLLLIALPLVIALSISKRRGPSGEVMYGSDLVYYGEDTVVYG